MTVPPWRGCPPHRRCRPTPAGPLPDRGWRPSGGIGQNSDPVLKLHALGCEPVILRLLLRAGLDERTPRAGDMQFAVAWNQERVCGEPCQVRLNDEKVPMISHIGMLSLANHVDHRWCGLLTFIV